MFKGFSQRLQNELNYISDKAVSITLKEKPYRKYISWIGASILASLSSFEQKWITKSEYLEHGPAIIHKKSLY